MRNFAGAVAVASTAFSAEFRPSLRHAMLWSPRSTAGSRRSKALSIPRNRGRKGNPTTRIQWMKKTQCELGFCIANLCEFGVLALWFLPNALHLELPEHIMQETDGVRAWLHGISSTGRSATKSQLIKRIMMQREERKQRCVFERNRDCCLKESLEKRDIEVDGHPHQPLWAQNCNSFPSGNGELGSPRLLMITFTACKLKQLELLNKSQCWASTEGQGFRKRINLWSPTWSAARTEYHLSKSKPQIFSA